jgi:hypothetical protein
VKDTLVTKLFRTLPHSRLAITSGFTPENHAQPAMCNFPASIFSQAMYAVALSFLSKAPKLPHNGGHLDSSLGDERSAQRLDRPQENIMSVQLEGTYCKPGVTLSHGYADS